MTADDPRPPREDVPRRRVFQALVVGIVLALVVAGVGAVPLLGMRADMAAMQDTMAAMEEDLTDQKQLTSELLDGIGQQLAITRDLADTAATLDDRAEALQEDTSAVRDVATDLRGIARGLRGDIVPRLDEALALAREGLREARVLREGTFERVDALLALADVLLAEIRQLREGAFERLDTTIDVARAVLEVARDIDEKIPESLRAVP